MAKQPATKNKGGRPKRFKSVSELDKKIEAYFNRCDSNSIEVYDKKREEVVEMSRPIPYSIEGLCAELEIDRKTLLNYSNDQEFFHTIKAAKQKILQNQIEAGLIGTADKTLTIFLLKNNYEYADKQEIKTDVTQTITEITRKYE